MAPEEKMKEPSPLVPQGSFEAQARSKSRVKLAFYTIVAIHVLAIGGFLIIGCKRDDKDAAAETAPPTNDLAVVPPIGSDPAVTTGAASATNVPAIPPLTPPPTTNTTVVADIPPAAMIEHTVVKNDNFSTIAAKYGVTVKAIQVANPNLNPTRLQIGDKVKIPPKTAVTTTAPPPAADAGLYTVKSGDTLSKIAATHKTTIKELQQLNNLPTTQIKVGQKLKVPQAAASPAPGGTPPPAQ
jgi:LysM repeat protein